MPKESWTGGRLDEFKENVNRRFDEVDRRFNEVDKRFDQVDKRLDRMDGDFRELRQAVNQLHNTMVIGFIGLAGLTVSGAVFF